MSSGKFMLRLRPLLVGLLLSSFWSSGFLLADDALRRPNVLFIAIDDLKPWIGCYGHPVVKTPNLDRIARMGTVFQRNYCQVAICGASRMSLLTGLRPDTTQVYNMGGDVFHIDTARKRAPQLTTLPGHFKDHGYICRGYGKVFDSRNTDNGQDTQSWSNPAGVLWKWDESLWPAPARGGYQNPETRRLIDSALADAKKRGMTKKTDILKFLSSVEGTRPVCESEDVPDEAYAEGNAMAARRCGRSINTARAIVTAANRCSWRSVSTNHIYPLSRRRSIGTCTPRRISSRHRFSTIPPTVSATRKQIMSKAVVSIPFLHRARSRNRYSDT